MTFPLLDDFHWICVEEKNDFSVSKNRFGQKIRIDPNRYLDSSVHKHLVTIINRLNIQK